MGADDLAKGSLPLNRLLVLTVSVPCHGEVWTDESLNILRASEHLQFSGEWRDYKSVVTYGWLRRAGEPDWLIATSCGRSELTPIIPSSQLSI